MNKTLIGIVVGIALVLIILVSMQLYKHTEAPPNQSNIQQPTNVTPPKPVTGRHFTIELNESLSVASH